LENFKLSDNLSKIWNLNRIYQNSLYLSDLINKSISRRINNILRLSSSKKINTNKKLQNGILLEGNYSRIWNAIRTYQDYIKLIDIVNKGWVLLFIEILRLSDGDVKDIIVRLLQEIIKLNDGYIKVSLSQDLMLFADNVIPGMLEISTL